MRKIIISTALILATNVASANGFSPWTNAAIAPQTSDAQSASVESAGFAPWRERDVTPDTVEIRATKGVATNQDNVNVFRPWS